VRTAAHGSLETSRLLEAIDLAHSNSIELEDEKTLRIEADDNVKPESEILVQLLK
jgi:hypothetical protein